MNPVSLVTLSDTQTPPGGHGGRMEEVVKPQKLVQKIVGAWPFWIMVVAIAEVVEVVVLVLT